MAWKRDSEEAAAVVGVWDMTRVAEVEELIDYDKGWMICRRGRRVYTASSGPRGSCTRCQAPKTSATADANVVVTIGGEDRRADRQTPSEQ